VNKEKAWAWVLQEVKKGRAFVSPAGSHVVPEPMLSFSDRLNACRDIQELNGFANRRRFDPSLPQWDEEQRSAILLRKMELEKQGMKK
jgi:hypothetical protein